MKKIIVLLFLTLWLSGCGKVPLTHYYLLDYIPTPQVTKATSFNLRIKDLTVAEAYKRPEIIYRQSAHEILFYNFHQWAVKPEHLVTDMVEKHIKSSNLFKSISNTLVDFNPDYTLTGQILAIEEYDNNEKWYSHLTIDFQLEETRTNKRVWQKVYDVRKEVVQKEPVYVVRELSALLENIVDRMILEIEKTLSQPPKRTTFKRKAISTPQDSSKQTGEE